MVFNVTANVEDNKEGWGPLGIPEKFTTVPFLPYGKGERLGRIAEFGYSSSSRASHHYNSAYRVHSLSFAMPVADGELRRAPSR